MDKRKKPCEGSNYGMNTSYAKGLVKNYADNQWQIINQVFIQDEIRDARCVWLTLADLKAFISEIEKPNPESKITNGIRIYFGAYSTQQPHPVHYDYDRLHTLLMIPTFLDNTTGMNTDYDAATGSSDFSTLATITALNHGNLTPPPFNSSMYQQGDLFMDYADNH